MSWMRQSRSKNAPKWLIAVPRSTRASGLTASGRLHSSGLMRRISTGFVSPDRRPELERVEDRVEPLEGVVVEAQGVRQRRTQVGCGCGIAPGDRRAEQLVDLRA